VPVRFGDLPEPVHPRHLNPQQRRKKMAGPLELFTDLERQVIALAAASSRECILVGSNPVRRGLSWLAARLVGDGSGNPLANERLEALRRLACISFATHGRPAETSVRAALQAGLSREQVDGLRQLAAA
jgi:hypothetical protein